MPFGSEGLKGDHRLVWGSIGVEDAALYRK